MNDKEAVGIERMKLASELSLRYYNEPLVVTTSGGKDSDVCIQLALNAGIPFEVQHNHTSADAPETVYHVRETFRKLEEKGIKCTVNYPMYKGQRAAMWNLIPQKMIPPTRIIRYCCSVLKEQGGANRFITTGVRWSESVARKNNRSAFEKVGKTKSEKMLLSDNDDKRMLFENCRLKAKRVCNPIVDWQDDDVWGYIKDQSIQVNCLYNEGMNRVGCIGCPMAGRKRREVEFMRWPKYKKAYIHAFEK